MTLWPSVINFSAGTKIPQKFLQKSLRTKKSKVLFFLWALTLNKKTKPQKITLALS